MAQVWLVAMMTLLLAVAPQARAGAGHFAGTAGDGTCEEICTGKGKNKICTLECPPTATLAAFGDSIAAGYDGSLFGRSASYVDYYAEHAAGGDGYFAPEASAVTYDGYAHSGYTTADIRNDILNNTDHLDALSTSDIVTWDAGGNDFLDARSAFRSTCDEAALAADIDSWKSDWDALLDTIDTNARLDAVVRTMNIYYPGVDDDRSRLCNGKTHFEVMLPLLLEAGDYMCDTAEARGIACADSIASMNCDQLADGSIDPACPTTLAHLSDGLHSEDAFRDANAVYKVEEVCTEVCEGKGRNRTCTLECTSGNLVLYGLMQSDDVHPNDDGHRVIAEAHHVLGY